MLYNYLVITLIMYQVYLDGVIGNSSYKAATEWRKYVCEQCKLYYDNSVVCKSPMRFKEQLDGIGKVL